MSNIFYFLITSTILFIISIIGIIINKKNIIMIIMSLEIMYLSINLNFIIFSNYYNNIIGQIFVFFTLIILAAETAIGLAILTVLNNKIGHINIKKLNKLKK